MAGSWGFIDTGTQAAGIAMLVFLLLAVLAFIFEIWMLVKSIQQKKWVWLLLILIMPLLGSILFFFFGRKKGKRR
jgi:hypothetical protein